FLICSDGLTDMIDDGAILDAVGKNRADLDAAARALVAAANRGGGEDNITVVFFELGGGDGEGDTAVTARAPALETAASEDEDTLSGIDAVPAVDTMVVPPEEAAALAAPPRSRSRRVISLLFALAILLIVAAAILWLLEHA
ncbi:MAG: hypothetical protein M3310_05735, partial [Actinomycetota bacterium]|nr:hypothetical protein [Actinomycetota bacterium]